MQNFVLMFDGLMDKIKVLIGGVLTPAETVFGFFTDFKSGAVLISVIFAAVMLFCVVKFKKPFALIRHPKCIAMCAMLIGANVILGYFSLNISSYVRIGFTFITAPVAAYLFGPCIGCGVAILSDIISLIIKPTGAWLFTYTLSMGIEAMICGLFLYEHKITVKRIFLYKLISIFAVNIILNSIAIAPTAASGLIGIFPARVIKNLILLPIQTFIVYQVLKRGIEGRVKC